MTSLHDSWAAVARSRHNALNTRLDALRALHERQHSNPWYAYLAPNTLMPELSTMLVETVAAIQLSDDATPWRKLQAALIELLGVVSAVSGPFPGEDERYASALRDFLLNLSTRGVPAA